MEGCFAKTQSHNMQWLEIPRRRSGCENLRDVWKTSHPVTADDLEILSSGNPPVRHSHPRLTSSSAPQSDLAASSECRRQRPRSAPVSPALEPPPPFGIHSRPFTVLSFCPITDDGHLAPLIGSEPILAEILEQLRAVVTSRQGAEPEGALNVLNSSTDTNTREKFFSGVSPAELTRRYGADPHRFRSRLSVDSGNAESDKQQKEETVGGAAAAATASGHEETPQQAEEHIEESAPSTASGMPRGRRHMRRLSDMGRPSRRILAAQAALEVDEVFYVLAFRAILELYLSQRLGLS